MRDRGPTPTPDAAPRTLLPVPGTHGETGGSAETGEAPA